MYEPAGIVIVSFTLTVPTALDRSLSGANRPVEYSEEAEELA
jgi:hypothetical protein